MIVTHTSPDLDAIASVWLVRNKHQHERHVVFIRAGDPPPADARWVVDVGGEYDPARGRFDHHHDATLPAATFLVYKALGGPRDVEPLIELIDAGDRGLPSARESRSSGLHALLSAWKRDRLGDEELLHRGCALLDEVAARMRDGMGLRDIHAWLRRAYAADIAAWQEFLKGLEGEAARAVVYRSPDGAFLAVQDGSPALTFYLLEQPETKLVVFTSALTHPTPSVAVGIQRAPESGIDCRDIVARAMEIARANGREDIAGELGTWFLHPSGFAAMRGTAKSPDPRSLGFDFVELAKIIGAARGAVRIPPGT